MINFFRFLMLIFFYFFYWTFLVNGQVIPEMNSYNSNLHFWNPAAIPKIELLQPEFRNNISIQSKKFIWKRKENLNFSNNRVGFNFTGSRLNENKIRINYGGYVNCFTSNLLTSTEILGKFSVIPVFDRSKKKDFALRNLMFAIGFEFRINPVSIRNDNTGRYRLWHLNDPVLELENLTSWNFGFGLGLFFSKRLDWIKSTNYFLYGGGSFSLATNDSFSNESVGVEFFIKKKLQYDFSFGLISKEQFNIDFFYTSFNNEGHSLRFIFKYLGFGKGGTQSISPLRIGVGGDSGKKSLVLETEFFLRFQDVKILPISFTVGFPIESTYLGPELDLSIQLACPKN